MKNTQVVISFKKIKNAMNHPANKHAFCIYFTIYYKDKLQCNNVVDG